jgi:ribosome-binding protein aMBF1 (putative translation factor)
MDLRWCGEDFATVIQAAYHKDKWLAPNLAAFLNLTKELIREASPK